MNVRKHAFALIFGSLLTIFAGGIGFLLFKSRAEYQEVKEKLVQAENRYTNLTSANPFPSAENVELVEQNAEDVKAFYDDLLATLCDNQPPREDVTPAQFADRLQDTFADLRMSATNETVSLGGNAKEFYFGFEQYTGVLPDRGDIPRLLGQLRMVQSVCNLLFENNITSLDMVKRDVFERLGADRSRSGMPGGFGGGMGGLAPGAGMEEGEMLVGEGGELYTVEEVDVIFTARDNQVWSVLDALGSSPQFTVVTSISLRNLSSEQSRRNPARPTGIRPRSMRPGVGMMGEFEEEMMFMESPMRRPRTSSRRSALPQVDEESQTSLLLHEDRIVAGREEFVEVTLALDIYRFCPEEPEEDEEVGEEFEFEG